GVGATLASCAIGKGGNGGAGGSGGTGGSGAGGNGGLSFSIFKTGTDISTVGNSLLFGSFGNGGVGGKTPGTIFNASSGKAGTAGAVFTN
ncbi:MAG: hypothetical protein EAZ17_09545, partial [Sphingobacteriales bacterium]